MFIEKPSVPNTCVNVEYENGFVPLFAARYDAVVGNVYASCGALIRSSCTHWPSNPIL